jgi:hypothetical protein
VGVCCTVHMADAAPWYAKCATLLRSPLNTPHSTASKRASAPGSRTEMALISCLRQTHRHMPLVRGTLTEIPVATL